MIHFEAQEHLAEIEKARLKTAKLVKDIRNRQKQLLQIVVKAFNERSEPINGVTVEGREVVLGFTKCDESPIGVCAYSERSMSIPGQLEMQAWREKHGRQPGITESSAATRTDACLFCGVLMPVWG